MKQSASTRGFRARLGLAITCAVAMISLSGCGDEEPMAIVEGTVKLRGNPLDNCLVTFLPDGDAEDPRPHSTAVTDSGGHYRLWTVDQIEGAAVGSHRVTIEDLSVSTGVRRRDHGTVDMEASEDEPRPKARRSRVPTAYTSSATTPWHFDLEPGPQKIDLEID